MSIYTAMLSRSRRGVKYLVAFEVVVILAVLSAEVGFCGVAVASYPICRDGLDNDGDGLVDDDDPACVADPSSTNELLGTACDDGVDNDSDGRIDLRDPGCLRLGTLDEEVGEFVINTVLDKIDADTADGVCETDVSGECSLRAAIMQANATPGLEGIGVPAGVYALTIPWTMWTDANGDLYITDDLVLIGDGSDLTYVGEEAIALPHGVLWVNFPSGHGEVTIVGMTFRGGRSNLVGGGIWQQGGKLTLIESTIRGNEALYEGGGIYNNSGTLTLIDSTVRDNTAGTHGGGIYDYGYGPLTLSGAIITGNDAGVSGGGIEYQAYLPLGSRGKIENTTVSGNTAPYGGGISNGSPLLVTHSTVSGNLAFGPFGGGGIGAGGWFTLSNSTVSGNLSVASAGGGIAGYGFVSNSTVTNNEPDGIASHSTVVTLTGSIIAANGLVNCVDLPGGGIESLGHNLSDDASCSLVAIGDLPETGAMLGPLADNGGFTFTHHPLASSPGIDVPGTPGCTAHATDQRGEDRPFDGDGDGTAYCDIGSVEYLPEPRGSAALLAGSAVLALLHRARTRTV